MSENEFDLDAFMSSLDEPEEVDPRQAEINTHISELATIDEQLTLAKAALETTDTFKAEAKKEIEEWVHKIEVLKQAIIEHDSKVFDERRELRRLENLREREQRALEIAMQQKKLADELAETQKEFDLITAGATWREWAKPHQIDGAKLLATARRGILADKMGLGKTLTSLATCDMLQAKKILVICPNDVMSNFQNETRRWAPHRTPVILGGLDKRQRRGIVDALSNLDEFICYMNFEMWRKDTAFLDELVAIKFDTLIIDEAHNIKNLKSMAWRGVKQLAFSENLPPDDWRYDSNGYVETFGKCSIRNVIPMTGTPILNRPQDLFPLLALVLPQQFGSDNYDLRNYLNMYCEQDWQTQKWKFGYGGLERLVRQLAGNYVMRDRKAAGIELPPQDVKIYNLTLDAEEYPEQYKIAQQLNRYAQIVLDEERSANIMYIIALITRKRQAMTWPAGIKFKDPFGKLIWEVDVEQSIKIDKVIQFTNSEINEWTGFIPDFVNDGERGPDGQWTGERVVVFSQFKEALMEVRRRCESAGYSVVEYDGSTPDHIKEEVKLDFDRWEIEKNGREPRWQIVLANYKTGGQGLNFTAATQTIVLDEEWNPGKRDQAYARTDRMGQTEDNTVHVLRVSNSIEDWMADLIASKEEMIEGFESEVGLYDALKKRMQDGDML